jgi:hypothetical protein
MAIKLQKNVDKAKKSEENRGGSVNWALVN